MEQWNTGMVEYKDHGTMEYWNDGINVKNPKDKVSQKKVEVKVEEKG